MFDSQLFVFGLLTFSEFGLYFLWYELLYDSWIGRAEKIVKSHKLPDPISSYGGRENSMILMGTIFIAGVFILLGAASQVRNDANLKTVLALSSASLYAMWLYTIQLTTRIIIDTEIQIKVISEVTYGPSSLQRELYGAKYGHGMIMIRRNHWLYYTVPINFAAIALSTVTPLVVTALFTVIFILFAATLPYLVVRSLSKEKKKRIPSILVLFAGFVYLGLTLLVLIFYDESGLPGKYDQSISILGVGVAILALGYVLYQDAKR